MSNARHSLLLSLLLLPCLLLQTYGYADESYGDAPDAIVHHTKTRKSAKNKTTTKSRPKAKESGMGKELQGAGLALLTAAIIVFGSLFRRKKRRKQRRGGKLKPDTHTLRPTKPAYKEAEVSRIPEKDFAKSPWWNIPEGTRIFIDTCVPMEAYSDPMTARWFKHLKAEAKAHKWKVVILNAVIKELDGLKNNDDEECSQSARHATNLLSDLQRSLGAQFVIIGDYRTPADDEFEREMKKGDILCTRDNNLALRINGNKKLRALGLMDFPRKRR